MRNTSSLKNSFAHKECSFDKPRLFPARNPISIWKFELFSENSSPSQNISRNVKCRFNNCRKTLAKRSSVFHSKFGILFITMINISKWSSGQVKGSFCQTYRIFFAPCSFNFCSKSEHFYIIKTFPYFFCPPIFLGETWKALSTTPTKVFRQRSEKMPKTHFLQITTFRRRFLCTRWMQFWQVCQKFFARSPNFLKDFYFSEKKLFFSDIFSRGM